MNILSKTKLPRQSKNTKFQQVLKRNLIWAVLVGLTLMMMQPSITASAASNTKFQMTVTKNNTTNLKEYLEYSGISEDWINGDIIFTSSNKKIATVTSQGVAKGINVGKTKISVKFELFTWSDRVGDFALKTLKKDIYLTVLPADGSTDQMAFEYEIKNKKVTITGMSKWKTNVVLPKQISGFPVTSIGKSAFSESKTIQSFTSLGTLETIGEYAFMSCPNLKKVVLSDSVKTIGEAAFCDCSTLTSISLGTKIKEIKANTFEGCSALKSISIPNSVTKISSDAFVACKNLTTVTGGSMVTLIGDYAFKDCKSLTSINLLSNVNEIEEYAFYNCASLTTIPALSGLKTLENNVFEGTKLTKIHIGNESDYLVANSEGEVEIVLKTTDKRNVYEYSLPDVTVPYTLTAKGNAVVNDKEHTITVTKSGYVIVQLNSKFGNYNINSGGLYYLSQEQFDVENKANEIVAALITDSMSDLMKAKVLHDYICTHTNHYIKVPAKYEPTAYGVLILGNGSCAGYQDAYKMLLDKAGVVNQNVDGMEYIHGWNAILIDGEWYNIDTSWDSLYDYNIYYTWFMKTDTEFYALSDKETEREFNLAHKVTKTLCTSTKFSNTDWYQWSE